MIKIIFFDFGNVFVTYDKVFNRVCNDYNLDREEFLKYYSRFEEKLSLGKMSSKLFWKKCGNYFNLNSDKIEHYDFAGAWVSDYEMIQPIKNLAEEMVNKLDVGIISNINSEIWEAALRDGWVPKIDYKSIILSYKVGIKKPDKKIYEIAQREVRVRSEEILFVDDKEKNLVEPKKMGWKTVLFDPNKAQEGVREIRRMLKEQLSF